MFSMVSQPLASTLCEECVGITFDDTVGDSVEATSSGSRWERIDTFPDFPILLSSAANSGCTFCAFLRFLLQEKLKKRLRTALEEDGASTRITISLGSPAYQMRSDFKVIVTNAARANENFDEKDGLFGLKIRFRCDSWPDDLVQTAMVCQHEGSEAVSEKLGITLKPPSTNVLDQGCLETLKGWLQCCVLQHPKCQLSAGAGWLPTRLIGIGATEDSTPRLIKTRAEALPLRTPYIALSYCWDPPTGKPQLTTTLATLPARLSAIPESTMPATHQDLVIIARRLGIRYVWIDALCIIQDDALDWGKEAASMFMVYRHAHLTVVAAAGDSCHSGFLFRPTSGPDSVGPCAVVPFRSRRDRDGTEVVGSYLLSAHRERCTWDANVPAHMHGCAWPERGWTFQEDIMSTRVMYFRETTSFFRCQMQRRLEHSVTVYKNVHRWHDMLSTPEEVAAAQAGAHAGPSVQEMAARKGQLYTQWTAMVSDYAERKLTVDGDKFPAISGLARRFSLALGVAPEQYCAGLWRGDFVRGLLWATVHNAARPRTVRAPSWSWAAWQGGLDWRQSFSQPIISKCTVNDVHVTPAVLDPFGKVKDGGWVDLIASVYNVSAVRAADPQLTMGTMTSYWADIELEGCGGLAAMASVDGVTSSGWKIDNTWKDADLSQGQLAGFKDVKAVLLAHTCVEREGTDELDQDEIAWSPPECPVGILVTEEKGSISCQMNLPCYRRIGMFEVRGIAEAVCWTERAPIRFRLV
ncbi:heterokaryon incompatibility protein-domain-containing protein [Podospora australis]|uniref:Heterokaryon incompatibility protein-domain-containing protein n=1 Tax=Podospora australis TaxID=1536484 RepID=A0AAN7AEP9_9PEZI|nr:heterokaryon incompatibility protein-domain-containing protein [Podospora australis]